MDGTKGIPRMRTAAKIVAEIKALDPDTEVTEFHIRKLAKDGTVPVVWATEEAAPAVGGIRRIDPKS